MPTITTTTRTTVRQQIASDLTSAITEAAEVVRYQRTDFGQWPFIRVFGEGSARGVEGMDSLGCLVTQYYLTIQVWVLMASKNDNTWQEEQAENLIDAIEQKIATWIAGSTTGKPWNLIEYVDRSRVDIYETKADIYLVEEIPVRATILH